MDVKTILLVVGLLISPFALTHSVSGEPTAITFLPDDSLPLGLTYDGASTVWVALHSYVAIAKVNTTDETYTIRFLTDDVDMQPSHAFTPYCLAIDPEGKIWISGSSNSDPCIYVYDPESDTVSAIENICAIYGAIYHQGYVWMTGGGWGKLYRFNYTSMAVVEYQVGFEEWCPDYNGYVSYDPMYIVADGDILWITLLNHPPYYLNAGFGGKLVMFNITSETWSVVLDGLDRPLGVAVDAGYVYVAQNTWGYEQYSWYVENPAWSNAIVKYDKATGLTSNITAGYDPYMVYIDSNGTLWWTDTHHTIGAINDFTSETWSTGRYAYFMTQVGNEIWYTETGSTGIYSVFLPNPDVNGDDKVDIKDIALVTIHFGAIEEDANWNQLADVNRDGQIDIKDVSFVARFYGETANH